MNPNIFYQIVAAISLAFGFYGFGLTRDKVVVPVAEPVQPQVASTLEKIVYDHEFRLRKCESQARLPSPAVPLLFPNGSVGAKSDK